MKGEHDVFKYVRGVWAGHALLAAHELGVIGLLREEGQSACRIAHRLSLDIQGIYALLSTLCGLGVVAKEEGSYFLTASGREIADPAGSLSGYLDFHVLLKRSWEELPQRIRQGGRGSPEPNRSEAAEIVKNYILAMDALGQSISADLAIALNVKHGNRVLDLGGGSSCHARAILARQPHAEVTLVDRPVVVQFLRNSILAEAGSPQNLRIVEGDYLAFEGDENYDLVLLANVMHNEGPESNAKILHSCIRALRPGGRLAVLDYLSDSFAGFSGPLGFEVLLYLITDQGMLLTYKELSSYLKKAGFGTPHMIKIGLYCLAIANKKGVTR